MNIGTLTVLMGVNTAGLRRGVVDMQHFEKSVTGSLGNISQVAQQAGLALTQMVTVPVAAIGAFTTKTFMQYERTMTQIVGLNGIAAKTTAKWSDELLKMAPATAQGPQELAKGLQFITGSGITGAQSLDVLKKSAMGATAGLGDVNTIAQAATSAILAYGVGNMDAQRAVNTFLLTIREGVGAPEEFVKQMGGVFQLAAKTGVQIEELGAAFAALTQQGVSAAEAETQIKAFLRTMVQQAPESEKALQEIGLSFKELQNTLQQKGLMAAFRMLNDAVQKFTDNGADQEKVLGDIFQNVRALLPVFALLGDKIGQTQAIFDRLQIPTDQLTPAFNLAKDSAWGKWETAVSKLKVSFIELGGVLSGPIIGIVQKFVEVIVGLVQHFQSLDKEKQNMIIMFTAIAATIGPLSLIFGQFVGLLKVFVGLLGMAGGWVTLFVAMGAAIYYTYKNWDLFTQAVKNFSFKGLWDDFNIWLNDVIGFGADLDKQVKKWDDYAAKVKGAEAIQSQIVEKQKQYNALMEQLKGSKSTDNYTATYEKIKNVLKDIVNLKKEVYEIDKKNKGFGTFRNSIATIKQQYKTKDIAPTIPNEHDMLDWIEGTSKSMGLKAQGVVKELQTAFDPQKVGFGDFFGKVFSDMGTDISNGLNMLQKKLTGIDLFKGLGAGGGLNLGKDLIPTPTIDSLKYFAKTVDDMPSLDNKLGSTMAAHILANTTEQLNKNAETALQLGANYDEVGNALSILEEQLKKLQAPEVFSQMSDDQKAWVQQFVDMYNILKLFQSKQVNVDKVFSDATEKLNANSLAASRMGKEYNKVQKAANILGDAISKVMEDPNTIKNMTQGQITQLNKMIAQWNEYKKALGGSTEKLNAFKNLFSSISSLAGTLGKYLGDSFSDFFNVISDVTNGIFEILDVIKSVTELMKVMKVTTMADTTATNANTAAKTANAAAATATTAANTGEALSGAAASGAKMPFPANLVAIAAGVAAVLSVIALISSSKKGATKMATGGIIPDGFPNDSFPAMLQSGEAVIPLKKMPEILGNKANSSQPQKVVFVIKGRTMEALLENEETFKNSF